MILQSQAKRLRPAARGVSVITLEASKEFKREAEIDHIVALSEIMLVRMITRGRQAMLIRRLRDGD
jgi:hypothetical protein